MRARHVPIVLAVLGLSGCSAAGSTAVGKTSVGKTSACIDAPTAVGRHALPNGETIRVRTGQIVYVELIEPEKYASPSLPRGFPWMTPSSSVPHVLEPAPICPTHSAFSTLPLRVSAFKALSGGEARILAPLTPAWRALRSSRRRGLRAYRATVRVGREGPGNAVQMPR